MMNSAYLLCLVIALGSGAAALSHELLWTRRLIDILGASGEATSLTLGCFFFGLSLGAAIAARRVRHLANAWETLARLEMAIAILSLPAALLPFWTSWLWPVLGPDILATWSGRLVKLAISGFVVLPPATAMGMTLPVLIVAMGKTVSDSPRRHVFVYGFNTLGGAFGLLGTSIWLLHAFGVFGSMLVVAATNLFVGLIAWSLRNQQQRSTPRITKRDRKRRQLTEAYGRRPQALPHPWLFAMAFYSGLVVMSLEVSIIHLLSLVVPSSFQATSSVLLVVILLLAVAALLVPALTRLVTRTAPLLLLLIACGGVACVLAPSLLYERTKQLIDVPHLIAIDGKTMAGLWGFHWEVFRVAIATVGPALLLSAAVFPMLLSSMEQESKDTAGGQWATLLAINGVGGLLGTITAEQFLIPTFGIYGGLVTIGMGQSLVACAAGLTLTSRWRFVFAIPGAIALVCCVFFQRNTDELAYISPHTVFKYQVLETRFGNDGVCCVVKTQTGAKGIMLNNQYMLGTTGVYDAQRRQVLIPLLLHRGSQTPETMSQDCRVCCLGLATGISAGAALDFSSNHSVTAVELSPTVIEVANDHFANENRNVVDHPRAEVIVEDARTYMAAVVDEYDVIAGDLYRPYASGQGRLYSLEHFKNVHEALKANGIYCQWIPAYQVTEEHFRTIAATFVQVFPHATLLCAEAESNQPILGLLGTKRATSDWQSVASRFSTLVVAQGLDDPVLLDYQYASSLFVAELSQEQFADVRINTLDNAILEINAGRHRATYDRRTSQSDRNSNAYLTGVAWKRFLNQMRNEN